MESTEPLDAGAGLHFDVERDPDVAELTQIADSEPGEVDEEIPADPTDDLIKVYLRDIRMNKLLTAEEEKELAAKMARGDKTARAAMIVANLRLVVKMSKRYMNRGLPFLDLVEEGNIGLIKAVDRFKLSKQCRFSTYGSWWIRQSIERAVVNQSRTIRLPVHISGLIGKIARATYELARRLNRQPTLQEVADQLQIDQSRVRELLVFKEKTLSIDEPLGFNSAHSLMDATEDNATVSPLDLIENIDRFKLVSEGLETLSNTERDILTLRFGLDDKTPQTLDAIGKNRGVSRERIRQIESQALQKLETHFVQLAGSSGAPTKRKASPRHAEEVPVRQSPAPQTER